TLRYDRLDNFWFCLMHELAHVARHLGPQNVEFFDDLDADAKDAKEQEADKLAQEALVPNRLWNNMPERFVHSEDAVEAIASALRVHPAIVAGRMRYESGRFKMLGDLVGS